MPLSPGPLRFEEDDHREMLENYVDRLIVICIGAVSALSGEKNAQQSAPQWRRDGNGTQADVCDVVDVASVEAKPADPSPTNKLKKWARVFWEATPAYPAPNKPKSWKSMPGARGGRSYARRCLKRRRL